MKCDSLLFFVSLPPEIGGVRFTSVLLYGFTSIMYIMSLGAFLMNIFSLKNKLSSTAEFFSVLLIIAMEFMWVDYRFYAQYEGVVLLSFGMLVSLLASKMIISSVTKVDLLIFRCDWSGFMMSLLYSL